MIIGLGGPIGRKSDSFCRSLRKIHFPKISGLAPLKMSTLYEEFYALEEEKDFIVNKSVIFDHPVFFLNTLYYSELGQDVANIKMQLFMLKGLFPDLSIVFLCHQ